VEEIVVVGDSRGGSRPGSYGKSIAIAVVDMVENNVERQPWRWETEEVTS
jgi:hypothetical protein